MAKKATGLAARVKALETMFFAMFSSKGSAKTKEAKRAGKSKKSPAKKAKRKTAR